MRIFIDSSDQENWRRYSRLGWVYGATTNPLILKKEGRSCTKETYLDMAKTAHDIGLQELQIQATGETEDDLFETGEFIAHLSKTVDIVVKVPLTRAGMAAGTRLISNGCRITMTAAYAAHQMIAATAMGAAYIAPYYGRLIEAGKNADEILSIMSDIHAGAPNAPRILVASIRSIAQLEGLCAQGFNTFTLSPMIAKQLAKCDLSDKAAIEFEEAARLN